ncbi:PAS domain-containing hybrid sensor histidine kinase/response regulator [Desulfonatronum parangueonense]
MNELEKRILRLEEENRFLREEKRKSVDALEMAACLGRFDTRPEAGIDRGFILRETAKKIRNLIKCKVLSFFLVDSKDNGFHRFYCTPEDFGPDLDAEVVQLIQDHRFAWILRRGRPVVVTSRDRTSRLLLHALTTPSRIRGMFIGVLDKEDADIPDVQLSLLSIVLLSSASALESIETYAHMSKLNRELEKYARETERQYQEIFENAPVGIFQSTPQGRYLSVNPEYASILGFQSPEEMTESITDVATQLYVHPEEREIFKAQLNSHGQSNNFEVELRKKDGKTIWVSMNTRTKQTQDGRTIYEGFLSDITQRKMTEKAIKDARFAAEAANRSKSEFLANMSHEIRTPINGIMGMMQLLEFTSLDDDQKQYVQLALSSAKRLNRLLSDILDLSRVEAGKMDVQESEINFGELRDSVIGLFSINARNKGIELVCSVDPTLPPTVIGDETRIRQILFNLVGNALKFTEKGKVCLDFGLMEAMRENALRIRFTVQDTGIGIPEDKLADIFEPFRQVEGNYTRHYQGAGLGLAIVHRLVHLMDGTIEVQSDIGTGTNVEVALWLKAEQQTPASGMAKTAGKAAKTRRLNILLAEDEPSNSFPVIKLLEKAGHAVTLAEDGQKALELLAAQNFDCVLMDIQMPVMNGIEATREIRRLEDEKRRLEGENPSIPATLHSRTPIIALTAYAMLGDREKFLQAGMDDYLAKPMRMKDLETIIDRVCSRDR